MVNYLSLNPSIQSPSSSPIVDRHFMSRLLIPLFWLLIIAGAGRLGAQANNDLPTLAPSYAEDFSHLKSFPSVCFDNVLRDESGRMFFSTCGAGLLSNLHLFEFDGYDFRVVKGALEGLKNRAEFVGTKDGHSFIGYTRKGDINITVYNVATDELLQLAIPEETKIVRTKQAVYADPSVYLLEASNALLKYQVVEGVLRETGRLSFDDDALQFAGDTLKRVIFYDDEVVWVVSPALDRIRRIEWASQTYTDISLPDYGFAALDERGRRRSETSFSINEFSREIYLSWFDVRTNQHECRLVDLAGRTLRPVDWLPSVSSNRRIKINQDSVGNLVFVFANKNENTALLRDTAGVVYDYSQFVSSVRTRGVTRLVSNDFKQQVIVCHERGFLLQTVQSTEAIRAFPLNISVRQLADYGPDRILVATQNVQRFVLNTQNGNFSNLNPLLAPIKAMCIERDQAGYLWAVKDSTFLRFSTASEVVETFPIDLKILRFFTLLGDKKIAYLTSGNEIAIYDLRSRRSTRFKVAGEVLQIEGFIHDLQLGPSGQLLVATSLGFWRIDLSAETAELYGNAAPFSDPRFLCIREGKDGKLWLGTTLNGLQIFDPGTNHLETINSDRGLGNNTVVSITEDGDGDRWLGTYNGVSLVNDRGELIMNLYEQDGLVHYESNRYAGHHSANGYIYVGAVRGISQINPALVKANLGRNENLRIYLTEATYPVSSDSTVQIKEGLKQISGFTLPASNRKLQLSLATSNYLNPAENKYAYRIKGLAEEWVDLGNQPKVLLDNLPAGRYRLELRGGDGNGNWSSQPLVFDLYVREYFYRQPWFYFILLFVIASLVASWINSLRVQVRQATQQIRSDKAVIESQAEKLQELDYAKNRFFTNISHEFRTPLTIIAGMAQQTLDHPKQWSQKGAALILRNSNNLLALVNQIMDLRKLESARQTVNYIQGDVVEFLQFLVESYQNYASEKSILLHYLKEEHRLDMDYDPDKLTKIISNLLSNAVKFTPEGGNIYLHLEQVVEDQNPQLMIRVKDTGVGIPAKKLSRIFDRYYQVEGQHQGQKTGNQTQGQGTGVGLALTKELVELLDGEISVDSVLGAGTTFLIKLPIRKTAAANTPADELRIAPPLIPVEAQANGARLNNGNQLATTNEELFSSELPLVLVVEDNTDMREYILTCLTHEYRIEVARDGLEGLNKAISLIPDLIVSDVMMPKKDGYTMCRELKVNEKTNHIPVVLLTAKGEFDAKMEGLESGAAAYLAKPFAPQELQVRLKNLLEHQQRLRDQFTSYRNDLGENDEVRAKIKDPVLLKLYDLVIDNLDDADLDMTRISKGLSMSRSQVYRKIKALTGQAPSGFVRSVRLQKARLMLQQEKLTISEVAYEVGFTSLNYFSTAFEREYGIRPSKVKK
ncbi:MAG: ATP-binding protein [Bacteroidota bacterium]